jgi:hypothetical protein
MLAVVQASTTSFAHQDTLIEQKYLFFVTGQWTRAAIPGMKHPSGFVPTGALQDRFAVMEPNPRRLPSAELKVGPDLLND